MRVTLSFEESEGADLCIMVDLLRASATITAALDSFRCIIPVRDAERAREYLSMDYPVAGERGGETLPGFIANSPPEIRKHGGDCLVLTTSNGTRILESVKSTALIGCLNNVSAVAAAARGMADEVEVIMAGVNGEFAIEDFLCAGEIIRAMGGEIDEYSEAAVLAVQDRRLVDDAIRRSRSARRLEKLGFGGDVEYCLRRNITDNVPVYRDGKIMKLL